MKPIVTSIPILSLLVLAASIGGCSKAADLPLAVGDRAPAFNLPGSDGRSYSLEEFAGKTVVLAWFPKAFTGG